MSLTKEFLESNKPIDSLEGMKFNSYEYDAIRHRFSNRLLIERTLHTLANCGKPRKPPLTYDDELQALASLLVQRLQELMDLEAQKHKAQSMKTLTGYFRLTQDEADRVWNKGQGRLEFEEGPCRKCDGSGRVEGEAKPGCMGGLLRYEQCDVCRGSGKDTHRIKVPEGTRGERGEISMKSRPDSIFHRKNDEDLLKMLSEERLPRNRERNTFLFESLIEELISRDVYPAETVEGNPNTVRAMVEGWGAWWHQWSEPLECPRCKADLRDFKLGPPFKREISHVDPGRDEVTHSSCPDCKGSW